jgi:hypothetical protein
VRGGSLQRRTIGMTRLHTTLFVSFCTNTEADTRATTALYVLEHPLLTPLHELAR